MKINFGSHVIDIIIENITIIWFNGIDIMNALGYKEHKKALQYTVSKNNKKKLKNIKSKNKSDFNYQTIYINESGLYELLLSSTKPNAKEFKKWITNDILPSLRKKNYYKMKKSHNNELTKLNKQLNFIKSQNKTLKRDLKKESYPKNNLLYVIDYSTKDEENVYRIGITKDLTKRKQIYNTHTLHKHKVVHMVNHKCPHKLEKCLQSLLYDYRYKNKKDFYVIPLKQLKIATTKCIKSMDCMDKFKNQNGGGMVPDIINNKINSINKQIKYYNNKIVKLTKEYNKQKYTMYY